MNNSLLFFTYLSIVSMTRSSAEETCYQKLIDTGIISEYADDVNSTDLKVVYPPNKNVQCGNFLSVFRTLTEPVVSFNVKETCENVTVLFVGIPTNFFDLDAILGFPYLHWLYVNINAFILTEGFQGQAGDSIADYFMPISPTRDHRYTFFIYCQKNYISTDGSQPSILQRTSFDIRKFASNNSLGNPLAINYFNLAITELPFPDLSEKFPIFK